MMPLKWGGLAESGGVKQCHPFTYSLYIYIYIYIYILLSEKEALARICLPTGPGLELVDLREVAELA